MTSPNHGKNIKDVQVISSATLTERLSYVFESLIRQLDTFDLFEKRISELAMTIMCQPFPEDAEKQLERWERFTRIHINYIETLRKVVGQINMEELTRAAGLAALFNRFKDLPPESLAKITNLIENERKNKDDREEQ